jgi:hypothetical protein
MAKYWKQGFYDEQKEGSVEITEEYWQKLLDGQSSGKEIKENEVGYPVLVDHEYTLDELKEKKIADINAYDKSDAVNSFILAGKEMWLNKEDRVGLVNSINVEKQAERLYTVLWFDTVKYTIRISDALTMLSALELYALDCYNVTQQHIAVVRGLQTKEEVESYNYEIGYPNKLEFSL